MKILSEDISVSTDALLFTYWLTGDFSKKLLSGGRNKNDRQKYEGWVASEIKLFLAKIHVKTQYVGTTFEGEGLQET